MTSRWTAAAVAAIHTAPWPVLPLITAADVVPVTPGIDLWDLWPLQDITGGIAAVDGGELWFALSAPAAGDPLARHAMARIRTLRHHAGGWLDLGLTLPDGFSPGSREWSGSAVLADDMVTLHFTAAGRRGEAALTYEQRLFAATATLAGGALGDWRNCRETATADGGMYVRAAEAQGAVGTIKAFRDPGWCRDPAGGQEYLLFAGSDATSISPWNGVVGAARREGDAWTLLPPLVTAAGVNNELERPHLLVRGGRYYLFWSTQRSVFASPGPSGPTGLYGMVADAFAGPYRPLNGTGLVLANPPEAGGQAYSWLVLADLRVVSFVDRWGIADDIALDADTARRHFGGVPALFHHLTIDGDRAW